MNVTPLSQLEFKAAYERLCGKNVLFPQAFHTTGMPIKVREGGRERVCVCGRTRGRGAGGGGGLRGSLAVSGSRAVCGEESTGRALEGGREVAGAWSMGGGR